MLHRLDLPVSGIVLCTRGGGEVAKRYGAALMSRNVEKKYLCRVKGNFPRYIFKSNLKHRKKERNNKTS